MNELSTIVSYARMAAADLPVACAKLLAFDRAVHFRAALADIEAFAPSSTAAHRLLTLCEKYVTMEHERRGFLKEEREILYEEIVPLLPIPADTPWGRVHGDMTRSFGGYELTLRYNRRGNSLYSRCGTSAFWMLSVTAPGIRYTELARRKKGSPPAMRKELEAWVRDHPIVATRLLHAKR